ncbi:hypothetical protein ACQ4PT_010258 [Festuca glaucescens]
MAGIVGSAVAGEAVRRLSFILLGEEGRDQETTEIRVDRVEMAVLKIETVVAMSEDWQITHAPLLRWRAKLKRVLKEGKGIIRTHRRNTTMERRNSFPRRMTQAARRFVHFSRGTDHPGDVDLTDSTVRRFERIADGADDFFQFVRCGGGRPRILVFLPGFARSLSAGETMELSLRMEGGTAVMLLQPWWFEFGGCGIGTQATALLRMSYEHDLAWERNFKVIAAFRPSETTNVVRVPANSVVLLSPQFGASCVAAMKDLVAGMASRGRNYPAASAMYASFVLAVQESVTEALKVNRRTGDRQRIREANVR